MGKNLQKNGHDNISLDCVPDYILDSLRQGLLARIRLLNLESGPNKRKSTNCIIKKLESEWNLYQDEITRRFKNQKGVEK